MLESYQILFKNVIKIHVENPQYFEFKLSYSEIYCLKIPRQNVGNKS